MAKTPRPSKLGPLNRRPEPAVIEPPPAIIWRTLDILPPVGKYIDPKLIPWATEPAPLESVPVLLLVEVCDKSGAHQSYEQISAIYQYPAATWRWFGRIAMQYSSPNIARPRLWTELLPIPTDMKGLIDASPVNVRS